MQTIGTKIDEVRVDGSLEKFRSDLQKITDMGISAVELPVHGLDVIFNGRINNRRLGEIINILADYSLKYSIHAPNPLNLMDENDQKLHENVLLASLEFARQTGAKVVVYHAGRFIPEEKFNFFPAEIIYSYKKKFLKKKEFLLKKESMLENEANLLQNISGQYPDICIAIENSRPYIGINSYSYGEYISELKKQVQRVNRDNVKINLDFGHLYMTSEFYKYDLAEAVRSIKGLVVHTHIHDNFGGAVHHWEKQQTHQLPFGRGDSHMPVGWGEIPIKEILDILLPDYNGLLMMELRSRYFKYIRESMENLMTLLNTSCYEKAMLKHA